MVMFLLANRTWSSLIRYVWMSFYLFLCISHIAWKNATSMKVFRYYINPIIHYTIFLGVTLIICKIHISASPTREVTCFT
jgi:hypothetical protein